MGVKGDGHLFMRLDDDQKAELLAVLVEELGVPQTSRLDQYRTELRAFGGQTTAVLLAGTEPTVFLAFDDDVKPSRQAACSRANARLRQLVHDWGFELFPEGAPKRGRLSPLAAEQGPAGLER